jgi:hypothetical protein
MAMNKVLSEVRGTDHAIEFSAQRNNHFSSYRTAANRLLEPGILLGLLARPSRTQAPGQVDGSAARD